MANRIKTIQSLRFFASLGVFQYHLWTNYLHYTFLSPATDFFFLMVGFVFAIVESQRYGEGRWGQYIWKRYLRLYITFVPVFFIYLIAGQDEHLTASYLVKSFFFIPIQDNFPLVGPTWMLSQFLLFYWLGSLAFLTKRESTLYAVFALWGAGCIFFLWSEWRPAMPREWFNLFFDERNLEFIFGYLAGKLVITQRTTNKAAAWLLAGGITATTLGFIWINYFTNNLNDTGRSFIYGVPVIMIIIGISTFEQQKVQSFGLKLLTHPWVVWLGNISYILYLLHNMLLAAWDRLFHVQTLYLPIIIIYAVLISAIVYQFWERPVLGFIRHHTLERQTG